MKTLADYEAWKSRQQQNGVGAAKVVLGSVDDAPDAIAKDMTLGSDFAKATGNPKPPLSMVKQYRPVFERQVEQAKASAILSSSPLLAEWLRNPENAGVARDDLDNLSWFEQQARALGGDVMRMGGRAAIFGDQITASNLAERASDRTKSIGEIYQEQRDHIGLEGKLLDPVVGPIADLYFTGTRFLTAQLDNVFGNDTEGKAAFVQQRAAQTSEWVNSIKMPPGAEAARDAVGVAMQKPSMGEQIAALGEVVAGNPAGFVEFIVHTAIESAPFIAAAAGVGYATRSPGAAMATMFAGSAASASGEQTLDFLREAGHDLTTPEGALAVIRDPELMAEAQQRGLTYGVFVGVVDAISGGVAGEVLSKSPLANMLLQTFLTQPAFGAGGEALGQVASGQPLNMVEVLIEAMAEVVSAPLEVAGFSMHQFKANQEKAAAAEATQQTIQTISEAAQSSKVRERTPEVFEGWLKRALKDGPVENVFVPASAWVTYFQSQGVDPFEMAATISGVTREDLETAVQTGGDLKIPTASYATVMAGSPHDPFMVENMKLSPDDMTVTEAMEFNDKAQDAMQEAWELAEAVRRDEETYRAVETQIYDEMVGRLRTAGRSTDVATTEALLYPAFYRTMAERSGMAIEEFLAKHPLPQVRGAAPAGMQLRDADALTRTLTEARARRTAGLDTGQSLLEFISERGGILDPGGELKARDASVVKRGKGRKTLRLERRGVAAAVGDMLGGRSAGGHGFDDVARAAIEAGFMADDPTVLAYQQAQRDGTEVPDIGKALLDAIDRELRGETVAAAPVDGLDQIEEYLAGLGVSLDDDDAAIRQAMEEGERKYGQADMQAPGGGSMRGQIAFGDAEAIVTLFQSADLSTFVHESGHFFLEALRLINTEEWSTVAEYLGVGPDGVLTVEQHEKFATEFEAYALSGKAPSLTLRAAFEKFRAWLLSIYRKARGLNVEVSPELRTVFDRMLATDAEILAAQRETAPDMQVTADDLGMTADQFAAFTRLRTQAKDEAAAKLLAETMAPIRRAATEAYKNERKAVRTITEKRLRDMPMFRAVQELRFGRDFQGNEIQPVKLDRAAIERDYGAGWLPQLPGSTKDGKGHKNAVFAHEGGLHPDIVAGMYGYQTGGQLLDALAKAPAIDEAIDAETDRIMRERHSDPLTDGSVQQLALDAVHGDKRGEALAAELRALNEVAGFDRGLTVKEARETARRTLRTMRVRDASAAHRFLAAERKAGQEAMRLTATVTREGMWMDRARRLVETRARGAVREADAGATLAIPAMVDRANATTGRFNEDAAAAVEAKRRQLMNHMLYAEARKVAAETEAVVDRLARLNKPDAKLGKTRNVDFVKAARAVAARFGLAAGDKQFEFSTWIEQLRFDDPVTAADLQYSIDVNSQEARHFKDLTVAEFETTAEAIENILSVGKRARELEIDGQRVERDLAISELTDQAEPRMKERAGTKRAPTKGEKRKIDALTIGSALVRVEAWARDMDDGEAGVFTRYLVKPVMDALGLYREARTARLAQLLAIIEPRRGELLGKAVAAPELGYTFENKGELLHAILHTGNESNLEKLLMGRGWSTGLTGQQQRVTAKGNLSVDRQGNPLMTRGRVDTSKWDAMVNRLVADGTLTKEDFDTAQAIWDLMDEIKRPAQAAHRRMFGFYFKEVEAMPVVTPFGSYRGGYVPAIIDQYAAVDAGKQDAAAAMDSQMDASMFPTTGSGFTKSRVQNYRQPLALNLTMLPSHMDKVLRFTHLEPTIRQTASLIGNSQVRTVLGQVNPDAIDGILTPWLVRVARNTVETPSSSPAGRKFAGVMRALRKRVGLHTMALNIVNAAQQVTGVASAMVLVKPGRVKSAMARFAGNAGAMRAEAAEASLMMRDRLENSSRITSTRIEEIIVAPTVQGEIGKFVDRHGYVLQQAAQNMVDVVVWHAARDQAVANGMDDDAAVFEADSVVRRTQGSFNPEDISTFEAGTAFTRAFTMFYSYFNTQLNLVGGVTATTIRTLGWNAAPKLFPLYFFGVLVPAVVAEAIVQGARGELGDEDDDGYLDDLLELFIGSQVRYVAGAVPILGPLTMAAINGLNDLPYDDRLSTSPVVSTAERVARTPGSVVSAVTGEGSASKAVVDSLTTLGLVFGIPTGQLAKSAGYAVSVAEGRSEPENLIDVVEGLASGRDGSE